MDMTPPSSRLGPMPSPTPDDRPRNRAALLVIRAWVEDPAEPSLRAQIREVANVDDPEEVVQFASTREELHAVLDRWLNDLLGLP